MDKIDAENILNNMNWLEPLCLIYLAFNDKECRNKIISEHPLEKLKEELDKIDFSNPGSQPDVGSYCCCCSSYQNVLSKEYQEDCYFYYKEQDTGAHISCCSKSGEFEPRNCNKECPNYITEKEVSDLVKNHLITRKELE